VHVIGEVQSRGVVAEWEGSEICCQLAVGSSGGIGSSEWGRLALALLQGGVGLALLGVGFRRGGHCWWWAMAVDGGTVCTCVP